jgi:hypothetical protein
MIFDIWEYEKFSNLGMLESIYNSITTSPLRSLGYTSAMYHRKGLWYMDEEDYTMFLLRWA